MADLQRRIANNEILLFLGCKTTHEIVISTLRQNPIAVKKSLERVRTRILYSFTFKANWNVVIPARHQQHAENRLKAL